MLGILLVSISLGLSNFAGAISIGLRGINKKLRIYTVLIFGFFEAVMPIIGFLVGKSLVQLLNGYGYRIGSLLLIATGGYDFWKAHTNHGNKTKIYSIKMHKLFVTGLTLSIDNLIVGFSLAFYHLSLFVLTTIIVLVSIVMSLIGLEIGRHVGRRFEEWSGELGAIIIMFVGILLFLGFL
jgi:putative Mn2+ efflux pump MntP